jgi:hypothetical protein
MPGQGQQGGMKADRLTLALQHRALQIVGQQHPGHPAEGRDRAAQEVRHASVQREAQEDRSRVGQHHHEGHQRPPSPTDSQVTKMAPVDLGLLPRQGPQPQVGLRRLSRPMPGDAMAEVVRSARIAALAHHGMEAAGRQGGKLLQRLPDEGPIGIHGRGPRLGYPSRPAGLRQHPLHRAAMHAQLGGDGPFFHVLVTEDAGLQFVCDRHVEKVSSRVKRIE